MIRNTACRRSRGQGWLKTMPLTFLRRCRAALLAAGVLLAPVCGLAQPGAELPAGAVRIASPWPAQNTIIAMLGYGPNIVGTSLIAQKIPLFRQAFPGIVDVPAISMSNHEINPEQIIGLRTELLFVPENMQLPQKEMLAAAGVKVLAFKANSMQALVERVLATGKVLGPDAQAKAVKYQQYFADNVQRVRQRLQGLPASEKVTLYHSMGSALITTGRPSLNQDWMDLAGAQNVAENWFRGKPNSSGEVPMETVAQANPDVIVVMNKKDAEVMQHSPQWQGINAIKNHRVYVNPRGMFWWCRESSEEALQFLWLAKMLYPARFADIDMAQETWRFYHEFFGLALTPAEVKAILNP